MEVDHVIPISLGGSDDYYNLVTACFLCNRGKCNDTYDLMTDDIMLERAFQLVASSLSRLLGMSQAQLTNPNMDKAQRKQINDNMVPEWLR